MLMLSVDRGSLQIFKDPAPNNFLLGVFVTAI